MGAARMACSEQKRIDASSTELFTIFLEIFKYYGEAAAGGEYSHMIKGIIFCRLVGDIR